jgi:hypothetical protein
MPQDLPAAVIVASLALVPVFAATVKFTLPLPVPLRPSVIETHGSLDAACQAQPLAAPTRNCPVPPDAENDCVTVKLQPWPS